MRLSTRLSLSYAGLILLLGILVTVLAGIQLSRYVQYVRSLSLPASPAAAIAIADHLAEAGLTAPVPEQWTRDTVRAGGWVQIIDHSGQVVTAINVPESINTSYSPPQLAALAANHGVAGNWVYELIPVYGQGSIIGSVLLAAPTGPRITSFSVFLTPAALQAFRRYFLSGLMGAIVTAVVLSLLVGFWYARRLARPLIRLQAELRAAAAGDFSHRIPIAAGNDEISTLGLAYNQMVGQLERVEKERTQLERARHDLVANISHDLRTPLTAVLGFTERMADEQTSVIDRQRCAEIVAKHVRDLDSLLGDLLELSRLQATLSIAKEPQDVAELVREEVIALMVELEQARLTVDVALPDDLPLVPADGRLLRRALQNLLVNTIRHAEGARLVSITAQRDAGGVDICVADDGRGIPAKDLPLLFERYYRGTSATAQSRGSGLGLAIVGQIMESHGGRVTVQSREGQGTIFTLWLPV